MQGLLHSGIPKGGVTGYVDFSGALVGAVEADQAAVQSYSGGIVSSDCGTNLDHGILAVGYNSAAGYYLVKNSWGASWGDGGYLKISTTGNLCGITSQSYHVTVNGGATPAPTPAPRPPFPAPACEDKEDYSFCEFLVEEQSFVGPPYPAKSFAMMRFISLPVPLSVLAESECDSVTMLQISQVSQSIASASTVPEPKNWIPATKDAVDTRYSSHSTFSEEE